MEAITREETLIIVLNNGQTFFNGKGKKLTKASVAYLHKKYCARPPEESINHSIKNIF